MSAVDPVDPADQRGREPAAGGAATVACPLCGTLVAPADDRCPACNTALAGVGGRPGPFSRSVLWWWAAALVAIYVVALAVVALVPA